MRSLDSGIAKRRLGASAGALSWSGWTQGNRWGDGTWGTIELSNGSTVSIANGDRGCSSGIISALEAVQARVNELRE